MKTFIASEKLLLLGFFLSVITVGSVVLNLPISWRENVPHTILDGIFFSVSAVCVTGLSTLPVSSLSFFGQVVLLGLIQFGGLGIITITTLYLILPWARISFRNTRIIKEFFLDKVEFKPRRIIRDILVYTLLVEGTGAILLWLTWGFAPERFFYAIFHAVSAFCNAGFSLEDSSLWAWRGNPGGLFIAAFLIIAGGLGWVVMKNLFQKFRGTARHLSFHSLLVLISSGLLILVGGILFFLFDRLGGSSRDWVLDLGNSFFYSVVTRTAGFNLVLPSEMSPLSQLLTLPLMIIGASPGSTGGGVKTTVFVLFILFVLKGAEDENRLMLGEHRVRKETVLKAVTAFVRYFIVYVVSVLVLYGVERVQGSKLTLLQILYESASAIGTVGLTLDTTPYLSTPGKWIIMLNMFIGRVGLLAFGLAAAEKVKHFTIKKPRGEVMI